ncbi:MAG: hypothetical protein GY816_23485 [Cytophagales bacterium]|nr:hypothetical protein [Cytophagales bacterium]
MKAFLLALGLLFSCFGNAQDRANILTKKGLRYKNVEIIRQTPDTLSIKIGEEISSIPIAEISKIQKPNDRKKTKVKYSKVDVEISLQVYSSKPGKGRTSEEDPALMIAFSYPLNDHLSLGIGSGLQVPHFTTTLIPVYGHARYSPLTNRSFFIRGRLGEFIPLSPEMYKGGLFSELTIGKDFALRGRSKFQFALGYSRQSMTRVNENFWWDNHETHFTYNRIIISIGMVF